MFKLNTLIWVGGPGTMNPFQHGEVFVTDDGTETNLDLGHYRRFTHAQLGEKNNYTLGSVYLFGYNEGEAEVVRTDIARLSRTLPTRSSMVPQVLQSRGCGHS